MVRPRACCFLMSHWALGYIVRHLLDFFHRTSFFDIFVSTSFQISTQCHFIFTMKEYAKTFYKSEAWKKCREAYAKSKGELCEVCLSKGFYVPGEIVHHKIHITPKNILDPNVTLDWKNLQLVCRRCHAEIHHRNDTQQGRRYEVDSFGRAIILPHTSP